MRIVRCSEAKILRSVTASDICCKAVLYHRHSLRRTQVEIASSSPAKLVVPRDDTPKVSKWSEQLHERYAIKSMFSHQLNLSSPLDRLAAVADSQLAIDIVDMSLDCPQTEH